MAGGDKCEEKMKQGKLREIKSTEGKDLGKQAFIRDGQRRPLIN